VQYHYPFWDPHASRLGLYFIGLTAMLSDVKLCNQPNSLSLHGIAMQRGLYFTPVVFPLFWRLISEVTELNGSPPNLDTYLRTTVIRKIWSELPRAFTPTGRGINVVGTDFELWQNMSLQRNMASTIGKKLFNLEGLPYMSPKCVKLWSINGWERLASFWPSYTLSHSEMSPYRMHVI